MLHLTTSYTSHTHIPQAQCIQRKYALTQYRVVLSTLYSGEDVRTTPAPNERGTKRLPWQQRLPSNGATNSEIYDRIFQKCKSL